MSKTNSPNAIIKPEEQFINIVFSSDDNYAPLLGIALCSIFENNNGKQLLKIFVVDDGISPKNKTKLNVLEKQYGFSINYIVPEKQVFVDLPRSSWPIAAYYRIIAARLLPEEIQKIIYLDCDVLVRKDLNDLFLINLEEKILGAVFDPAASEESCARLRIPYEIGYFNSGVLLINMDLWRNNFVEEKLLNFINKNKNILKFPDNDALNAVLFDKWLKLPAKYNAFNFIKIDDPAIIHFTSEKSWYLLSANKTQNEYLSYVSKTPWKNYWFRKIIAPSFAEKYHFLQIGLTFKKALRNIKQKLKK